MKTQFDAILSVPTQSNRIGMIDIAKGIGILLVIIGHMDFPLILTGAIYSFHMPLFIILSGFVFKPKGILRSLRALLVPFVTMTSILSGMDSLCKSSVNPIFSGFLTIIGGGGAPHFIYTISPAMWFLPALAAIELISFSVDKLADRKRWIRLPICLLFAIIAVYLRRYKDDTYLPWNIDVACALLPFFELGRFCKKYLKQISQFSIPKLTGIALFLYVILIPLVWMNSWVNIFRLNYGNSVALYYLNALLGSFATMCIAALVDKLRKLGGIFTVLGRNTLVMMCVHQPLIALWQDTICRGSGNIAFLIIGFMIITIISFIISILIGRYFPWILGRRNSSKIEEVKK